jgi:hypothetical protein
MMHKKEIQDFKNALMLSNAVSAATNQYRNAMETDVSYSNVLTPSQLKELHKNHFEHALKVFEPITAQYSVDLWKPYVDQVKQV